MPNRIRIEDKIKILEEQKQYENDNSFPMKTQKILGEVRKLLERKIS